MITFEFLTTILAASVMLLSPVKGMVSSSTDMPTVTEDNNVTMFSNNNSDLPTTTEGDRVTSMPPLNPDLQMIPCPSVSQTVTTAMINPTPTLGTTNLVTATLVTATIVTVTTSNVADLNTTEDSGITPTIKTTPMCVLVPTTETVSPTSSNTPRGTTGNTSGDFTILAIAVMAAGGFIMIILMPCIIVILIAALGCTCKKYRRMKILLKSSNGYMYGNARPVEPESQFPPNVKLEVIPEFEIEENVCYGQNECNDYVIQSPYDLID